MVFVNNTYEYFCACAKLELGAVGSIQLCILSIRFIVFQLGQSLVASAIVYLSFCSLHNVKVQALKDNYLNLLLLCMFQCSATIPQFCLATAEKTSRNIYWSLLFILLFRKLNPILSVSFLP